MQEIGFNKNSTENINNHHSELTEDLHLIQLEEEVNETASYRNIGPLSIDLHEEHWDL